MDVIKVEGGKTKKFVRVAIVLAILTGIVLYWQFTRDLKYSLLRNKPIMEAMKQSLVLENYIRKLNVRYLSRSSKEVMFGLEFKNIGQKEVDEYTVLFTCKTLDGKVLKKILLTSSVNIPSGQTGYNSWRIDVNMSIAEDRMLYETPQPDLDMSVEIQHIKFSDGSELRLYENWALWIMKNFMRSIH